MPARKTSTANAPIEGPGVDGDGVVGIPEEPSADALNEEVERQKKYLAKLPSTFGFPLFNAQHALESQRRSGYRNSAAAAREIIDNSLEAKATDIRVIFERDDDTRRDLVSAVAFVDNGSGMVPQMIQYSLSWGGGTHFEDADFIGKFGFGLPNASINQTRRVEVYSKVKGQARFYRAELDVGSIASSGVHSIPPAVPSDLPEFVQRSLDRSGKVLDHGTVVVWERPDRLSYRTPATLKEHLVDDFGVVYRYLLDGISLTVEGTTVRKVDPLFLDKDARLFLPEDEGGAIETLSRSIPVKYFRDERTGGTHLSKLDETPDPKDPDLLAMGAIHVRMSRFPIGFVEGKGPGRRRGSADKGMSDAQRRFEIRKSRFGVSFVRGRREIETVDAFPRSQRDIAAGLGKWPLLQGYAYHYGIEVRFEPALDEAFGITNDKQTVRPIEDFWRVLVEEEIDRLVREEYRWQVTERKRMRSDIKSSDSASPAEIAAQAADTAFGRKSRIPAQRKADSSAEAESEAQRRVGVTAKSIEEARKAVEDDAKRRPFKVEYVNDPHGPFYSPVWNGGQVVVRINKDHSFFQTLYGSLVGIPGAQLAKEAVDLLLIALAKGELTVDDDDAIEWYRVQREVVWSQFLATAMRTLGQSGVASHDEVEDAA